MQAPPEHLGAFYLGAEYDLGRRTRLENPIIYDARDLTTHAVCVGMTGSGKTGLCIDLLEEAALDRVPALIIDPKGDLTNLLLQFPEMRPEDFRPWVNVDDARRKGMGVEEYAEQIAETWREGLAEWGQGEERIETLRNSVDWTIYTPGSEAGIPISILGSLAAPKLDFESHAETIRDRIGGTVVALLGLIGVDADPIRSREAILLSTLFEHFWRRGEDLDLGKLILSIQDPPVRQLGVFDVDTFFPESERFDLAMRFNGLVAAPAFQSWLHGESLDIDRLLYTDQGKPRHSIFYIAHLSESERMFFVTLLLETLITWMRGQSGTTSLRALLYFDEIFGFFPPVKEPPSKKPLLTLLKQARAYGLGAVLVTQNPVDIDYKGLTNAGTWLIGRLQAERDKERVIAGLKGAIAESGQEVKADYDTLINQLSSRIFLMHNVHENEPVVFQTRWAMSYLRGPLTRPQVQELMAEKKASKSAPPKPSTPPAESRTVERAPTPELASAPKEESSRVPSGFTADTPSLAPGLLQAYLPVILSQQQAVDIVEKRTGRRAEIDTVRLIYEAGILGAGSVRFLSRKHAIDERRDLLLLAPAPSGLSDVDWQSAERLPVELSELRQTPAQQGGQSGPFFGPVPEKANSEREMKGLARDLSDWLYYNSELTLQVHEELKIHRAPDESERSFMIRLQDGARSKRDEEVDTLRRRYAGRIEKLEDRLQRYERDLVEDETEYSARKQQEWLSLGETVLNVLLGRRSSRALSSVASKRRMAQKARGGVERTKQEIEELEEEIEDLQQDLEKEADAITRRWADLMDDLGEESLKPRRADVDVEMVALAWQPSWLIEIDEGFGPRGVAVPAYPLAEDDESSDD